MFVAVIKIKSLVQLGRLGRASLDVSIYCRDVTEGIWGHSLWDVIMFFHLDRNNTQNLM